MLNFFAEFLAGLVTLHETPNHVESLPIKMFEYMSAGLPVIASNFPLWREIIGGADCGICVDPTIVQAIADAMDMLATNRERAEEMGRNGQVAVKQKYNWATQAEKLLALYERLVGSSLSYARALRPDLSRHSLGAKSAAAWPIDPQCGR